METPQIQVNLSQGEGGNVLAILQGQAPDPINKNSVSITGNIGAVGDFIRPRESIINKDAAHIIFTEDKGTILLVLNEDIDAKTTVTASLEEYPDLKKFGINAGTRFTQREVEALIKMSRIFFPTSDEHAELLKQFKEFSAQVNSSIANTADSRANKNVNFQKQVTSGLAEEFRLSIPIFKGTEKTTFRVEICYDVTDASVSFWFESVELFELRKEVILKSFEEQSKEFKEKGFTVIHA